ncbi:hypothetical protein B0T14DRAFT_148240 [Immersiella caudata]|uniref:Protein kinase domain-containing protein n=1 Tax=Immersiella caudata TaxID=314043 RepID=A0AA40C2F7_9PEZI|nr:hypothetical protein B0T14DRAFT_148240 [Immersiella caudata]
MTAMRSAVHHLHSIVSVAHNDISPNNIMVDNGLPLLIDFGSCRPLGDAMSISRGTPGWNLDSLLPSRDGVFDPRRDNFSESACFPLPSLPIFPKYDTLSDIRSGRRSSCP